MVLSKLVYLDLSGNMIKEEEELGPLRRVGVGLEVCLKGNPVEEGWRGRLKGSSVRFIKEPKNMEESQPKAKL